MSMQPNCAASVAAVDFTFLFSTTLRPLDGNECSGLDCGNVTDVACPLFCFLPLEEGDLSC